MKNKIILFLAVILVAFITVITIPVTAARVQTEEDLNYADVNRDGVIDLKDILLIKKYIVGMNVQFGGQVKSTITATAEATTITTAQTVKPTTILTTKPQPTTSPPAKTTSSGELTESDCEWIKAQALAYIKTLPKAHIDTEAESWSMENYSDKSWSKEKMLQVIKEVIDLEYDDCVANNGSVGLYIKYMKSSNSENFCFYVLWS